MFWTDYYYIKFIGQSKVFKFFGSKLSTVPESATKVIGMPCLAKKDLHLSMIVLQVMFGRDTNFQCTWNNSPLQLKNVFS